MSETRGVSQRKDETAGGKRLLLVDDQALLVRSLARCFAHSGYAVRVAVSWMEAEVVSREEAFDCGIFDIALGQDDGIALARRLFDQHRVRAVVFFSATLEASTKRRAKEVGPIVPKDSGFDGLREVVERCCARAAP